MLMNTLEPNRKTAKQLELSTPLDEMEGIHNVHSGLGENESRLGLNLPSQTAKTGENSSFHALGPATG